MKEIRGHESMFSWFVRRTPDTFIYVKAILEGDLENDFSAAYNFLIHLGKERGLTKKQSVE